MLQASQTYQGAEQVYLERIRRADAELLREGPAPAPDCAKLSAAIDEIYAVRSELAADRRDLATLRALEPGQRGEHVRTNFKTFQ